VFLAPVKKHKNLNIQTILPAWALNLVWVMLATIQFRTFLFSHLLSKNIKNRSIIFPVVLCVFETWSLISREEHRVRVFQNRVLRRLFGPKRDKVTGDLRKLHNEELHDLYYSPNIIRVMK
jgi:hypothetical protein